MPKREINFGCRGVSILPLKEYQRRKGKGEIVGIVNDEEKVKKKVRLKQKE